MCYVKKCCFNLRKCRRCILAYLVPYCVALYLLVFYVEILPSAMLFLYKEKADSSVWYVYSALSFDTLLIVICC